MMEPEKQEGSDIPVRQPPRKEIIHSVVGDIHVPSAKIPFDLNIDFTPGNPVQIDSTSSPGYGVSTSEGGSQASKPGFWKTAGAEAYEFNATAELLHAGYEAFERPSPYDDTAPTGWNPQTQPEMFYDIQPQYLSYLMGARGPKDLQYRHERVMSEQEHDETLANGSMFARVIGGVAGAILDPINLIPIAGEVKYAKFAPTIMRSIARSFPGVAAYSVIQSGAKELDKVNGNLHDFVVDTFINMAFGSALFGGLKGGALLLDKMELWNLRGLAKDSMKGIDFKFELGEKSEILGIKAFDETGGSLSAAEVSKAQEIANAAFLKGGLFKIPYLGAGVLAIKGAPIIGSPLIAMANSSYAIERAFIDRAADHSFWRKGTKEGEASPKSFEHLMKREFAGLRGIAAQLNALHLERMGYDIKPPRVGDVRYAAQGLYSKSLKAITKDTEKYGWVAREQFDDEVQRALISGESSEHASVNAAYSIIRPKLDKVIKDYNEAFGKSQTILTPKMASEFLMRVYNIDHLNVNKNGKNGFVPVISNYFKEADQFITERMEPIESLKSELEGLKSDHAELIRRENVTNDEVKASANALEKKKIDLRVEEENLQNELRNNEELRYHVEDWYALSADEAKELQKLQKPLNDLQKKADEQKKIISELQRQKSKSKQASMKGKTTETAKKHVANEEAMAKSIEVEQDKLSEIERNMQDEEYRLYEMARDGKVNPQLYYPETLKFKDPNYRLKFRDRYASHEDRITYAKAAFDSIMHTNAEDTIADIMGKVTGNSRENHLKSRTLMVPDKILYDNNFMTKNLMSKINNYVLYVSRRTHLKNSFKEVTHDGGIEAVIEKLNREYKSKREPFDTRKEAIHAEKEALDPVKDAARIKELEKEDKKLNKDIINETKRFNRSKERMNTAYERMMGLRKREKYDIIAQGIIRSLVATANLHQLPVTQMADIGAIGLQHGAWPFIRDTVYPVLSSIGGLLKTKDSEAIRETLAHIDLGLQDVLNGHADKNISLETQPYVNMGPWVAGAEKLAHFSSNADLTTYADNWLQRWSAATIQSKFMKNLHKHVLGTASKKDTEYLLHYGIDPKVWGERMVKAYEDAKGFQTKLGGYSSRFWQWQDLEAANEFSSAVFRGVQNTIIQRGMFDSPFWADNLMGMLFHTFTGWGFASINRYVVPMLQRPDAEQLLGVMLSLGFGSMVSPLRRMARGEDYYPDNMTDGQKFYEVIADSNVSSALAGVLSWANYLSNDNLIGDLKNDKIRNRVGYGANSVVFGTANKGYNILASLASGEANEKDARTAAYMLPVAGAMYGRKVSDILLEFLGLPPNRRAAHAE